MNKILLTLVAFVLVSTAVGQLSWMRYQGLKVGIGFYPQVNQVSIKSPPGLRFGMEVRGKFNYWILNDSQKALDMWTQYRICYRGVMHKNIVFYQGASYIYEKAKGNVISGIGLPLGFEVYPFIEVKGLAIVLEIDLYYKGTVNNARNLGAQALFGFNYFFHKE